MPAQQRHPTGYAGVHYINGTTLDGKRPEKIYLIRYRKNGKSLEEKAGRQYRDAMTPAKASRLRGLRIEGKTLPNTERRELEQAKRNAEASRWTFQKLFREYLDSKPDLKGIRSDEHRFKSYLEKEFADRTPEELTHFDVERLKKRLRKKALKPATIRHALEMLRRLSNFGVKRNLCPGLSFTIEMPRLNNIKTEDLSGDQLSKLLEVLEEERDVQVANLVRLALFTGMRRGELFRLKWEDIDFQRGFIKLRDPKSGGDQSIPLNDKTEEILRSHPRVESPYVFPGRNGGQRTDCKRPLIRIKKRAGLPKDFRILHGLRHVYASMLASSGRVDLYTLQKLLTHKSPLMTQRYAHLRDEALRKASNIITDLVPSSRKGEVYRDS